MNKKWTTLLVIVIILVFTGYIVIDLTQKKETTTDNSSKSGSSGLTDQWEVINIFEPAIGQLNAITVSENGTIILGGESFIANYDSDFQLQWKYKTNMPVTALTVSGSNIYAAVQEFIIVLSMKGDSIEEWGPFEYNSIISSIAANETYVTYADAANKMVFILDKKGIVKSIIGKSGEAFIVPSPYFDVALSNDNILYAANPGNLRIETRNIDGKLIDYFGVPGTGPDAFCGCCNPAHFVVIPGGFVTAEKGINRIKILNNKGDFVEFVSSVNNFVPPLPLDLAAKDDKLIYAANPADSKVYVFRRKKKI